jgi:signal transduction histidine kinase
VEMSQPAESHCYGDEELLKQMILNLLDNAVKYTPRGGVVIMNLDRKNGSYEIAISDSGPGIPNDVQDRVFERFFRVDKTRSRAESVNSTGGGAGLGLAIARSIAEAHGGSLTLECSNTSGSTFVAVLPGGILGLSNND